MWNKLVRLRPANEGGSEPAAAAAAAGSELTEVRLTELRATRGTARSCNAGAHKRNRQRRRRVDVCE